MTSHGFHGFTSSLMHLDMSPEKWSSLITPVVDTSDYKGWLKPESFQEFLWAYEHDTNTKFVSTYTAKSKFGSTDLNSEKHYVRFEDDVIPYDGTPFMIINLKKLVCKHGPDSHTKHKERRQAEQLPAEDGEYVTPKKKRKPMRDTYKLNCPAKIVVKEVVRFPDFKLDVDTVRKRKAASCNVRKALEDRHQGQVLFFVTVPKLSDHKSHDVGENAEPLLFTDKRIVKKIHEFVIRHNVRHLATLQNLVYSFVQTQLFSGSDLPPLTNRRYWPTNMDLRNHMNRAVMSARNGERGQENLTEKVDVWKSNRASDTLFFCASTVVDESQELNDDVVIVQQPDMDDEQEACHEEEHETPACQMENVKAGAAACRELLSDIEFYTYFMTNNSTVSELKDTLTRALLLCKATTEHDYCQPVFTAKEKPEKVQDRRIYSDTPLRANETHLFTGQDRKKD